MQHITLYFATSATKSRKFMFKHQIQVATRILLIETTLEIISQKKSNHKPLCPWPNAKNNGPIPHKHPGTSFDMF